MRILIDLPFVLFILYTLFSVNWDKERDFVLFFFVASFTLPMFISPYAKRPLADSFRKFALQFAIPFSYHFKMFLWIGSVLLPSSRLCPSPAPISIQKRWCLAEGARTRSNSPRAGRVSLQKNEKPQVGRSHQLVANSIHSFNLHSAAL